MKVFTNFFLDTIAEKDTPKRTKLHHFLKIFPGEHAPNPP